MSTSLTVPDKDIVVLVEIEYGNGSFLRFCDMQETLDLPGMGVFSSMPSLAVSLPPYTGVFERKEIELEFAYLTDAFLFGKGVTSGRAFSPVFVRAWQWIRTNGSDRLRKLFDGKLASAVRNPSGRSDILKLNCVTAKAECRRSCGIESSNTCSHTFGDPKTCGVDLAPLKENGTITIISKNLVTITGLSAHADRYWHKGSIEADGVEIKIREWVSGTSFILAKLVPIEWEDTVLGFGSKAVVVTPGCDKRPETCEFTWNNLSEILPIGFAVPDYNIFFEDGA